MKEGIKKYLPFVALFFLLLHFSLSFIYAAPEQLLPDKMQQQAKKYTLPVFEQYWSLFAPAPKVNKKLFYKINDGEWKCLTDAVVATSRSNRFSASARKVVLYSNLLYYIVQDNCSCSKNKQNVVIGHPTSSYNALRYLLKRELAAEFTNRAKLDVAVWTDVYEKPFVGKKETVMVVFPNIKFDEQ